MKRTGSVLTMGFLTALFGCGRDPERSVTLPEITSEAVEGFVDLVFAITNSQVNPDGSASFHAQGVHKGETVGLRVLLQPPWKEGALGEDIVTFQGRVIYESTGMESDRLVQIMGELYRSSVRVRSMRKGPIPFTGITLEGQPRGLASAPVKIKLFVESDDEDGYGELYTNIDVPGRRLEIREKDPDYRDPVMRALGSE